MLDAAVTYWAHSARQAAAEAGSRAGWQLLAEHLEAAGRLASALAQAARPGDARLAALARLGGLMHDYGKYSAAFQRRITRHGPRCEHAIHGASLAYWGAGAGLPRLLNLAAAIAGHHAGVPDLDGQGGRLDKKTQRVAQEAQALWERARHDCPGLNEAISAVWAPLKLDAECRRDLFIRMLTSCIVDADRLDSATRPIGEAQLNAAERLAMLLAHVNDLAIKAPDGAVKRMRAQVLEDCLAAADLPARLFSLSVPTGGGKTLASMAFALRRAALRPSEFRRVIVVIPYLSIIEQNAEVYAKVFGPEAVLEHHSGAYMPLSAQNGDVFLPQPDPDDEDAYQQSGLRAETENWDAPLIVTTSVRFFESLFSNHPRDLRRVHNIARSIVILDEVQTLPRRLLAPLLGMMRDLTDNWGVNFVFSTATQPAFERPSHKHDARWEPGTLTEIIRDPAPLRAALKRAEIRWEVATPRTWPQVAGRALEARQSLTIVNLRRHASELYAEVLRQAGDPSAVFHLSTRMCAAHRLRRLALIRQRLKDGEPCHVVSTQLVEAGVDVDFPLVLRALGPLDAIIQAAGRADREGRLTAELGRPGGLVVVFQPEDNAMPPHEYKEAAGKAQAVAEFDGLAVDSIEAMQRFFERYYGEGADLGDSIVNMRETCAFAALGHEFEMISSRTRDVFVPDDDEARAAIRDLERIKQLTGPQRRALQRHTVGLNPSEFEKARGVIYELTPASEVWIAMKPAYNEALGLGFEARIESLIVDS
jgi:CRISPR-associated endonuclease/helicase Cas3